MSCSLRSNWYEVDPDLTNNSAIAETTVKGPNPPMQITTSESRHQVTIGAWVPCANDFVLLDGYLHSSYHALFNIKGGFCQYESGISGKGLSSGETYHATGMTRDSYEWTNGFPSSYSYQNNFRIIGENTGNDLLVHAITHVTFAADGTVKNSVTSYTFDCK